MIGSLPLLWQLSLKTHEAVRENFEKSFRMAVRFFSHWNKLEYSFGQTEETSICRKKEPGSRSPSLQLEYIMQMIMLRKRKHVSCLNLWILFEQFAYFWRRDDRAGPASRDVFQRWFVRVLAEDPAMKNVLLSSNPSKSIVHKQAKWKGVLCRSWTRLQQKHTLKTRGAENFLVKLLHISNAFMTGLEKTDDFVKNGDVLRSRSLAVDNWLITIDHKVCACPN